jgi:hypothetical protein
LAPAALVGLFVVITGTLAARFDGALAMGGIAVGAIIVGWLVGPLAKGSTRADLFAVVAYTLVAGFVYVLVGSINGAVTDVPGEGERDLSDRLWRLVGQSAYRLLYLPFWGAFVSPFALAWVVAVRVLRRRLGLTAPGIAPSAGASRPGMFGAVRPHRIVLLTAGVILIYGLFVGLVPLAIYHDPRPPWWIQRPVALLGLFSVPAVVAAIGAVRGVRPFVAAAGVLCLLQSYIAFSGVTIGFVVPGLLLLVVAGVDSWPNATSASRAMVLAAVVVIALAVGAWISLFALTEPRCWEGAVAPDGSITIFEVPATQQQLYGPAPVPAGGSGCSSAELTVQGMGVSAVLAIGAIAMAAVATSVRRGPASP